MPSHLFQDAPGIFSFIQYHFSKIIRIFAFGILKYKEK